MASNFLFLCMTVNSQVRLGLLKKDVPGAIFEVQKGQFKTNNFLPILPGQVLILNHKKGDLHRILSPMGYLYFSGNCS